MPPIPPPSFILQLNGISCMYSESQHSAKEMHFCLVDIMITITIKMIVYVSMLLKEHNRFVTDINTQCSLTINEYIPKLEPYIRHTCVNDSNMFSSIH